MIAHSIKTCVEIPAPWPKPFSGGIRHPELWLWDSWIWEGEGRLHLYCLALARQARDGTPIHPHQRNDHRFHVREFVSDDRGQTFCDHGAFFHPGTLGEPDRRNVWSGHVFGDRRQFFAYTGISSPGPSRPFLQSICLAEKRQTGWTSHLLSCPELDYDAIGAAGYYLGPRADLGHAGGEAGGPILAWRDPFALKTADGIRLFWSAKIGPKTPAVASADLRTDGETFELGPLHPPMRLPDAELMTQAEVPKLYPVDGGLIMLIAACDRLYEGQPDSQVSKLTRAYRADTPAGPWRTMAETSAVEGLGHLFGVSAITVTGEGAQLIGPYTEMAPSDLRLSFSTPRTISF